MTSCVAYPCLLRSACSKCLMLLHVDDILCLVHEKFLSEKLMPVFEGHYKVAIEVMRNVGDELCFEEEPHFAIRNRNSDTKSSQTFGPFV